MSVSDILESVLPAEQRYQTDENARRARQVVWLCALLTPIFLMSGVVSTVARGPNILGWLNLAAGIGVLVAPALLRATTSSMPAAFALLAIALSSVSAVAWAGYGPLSPAGQAFVMFPVLGFVLGGARLGVPFSIVVVVEMSALVGSQRLGFVEFPLEATGMQFVVMYTMVATVILIVVNSCLWSYDSAWRAAEAANLAAQEELAAASEAKSVFLGQMSHELRTPLTAILGYAELLEESANDEDRQDLRQIERAGKHLLGLVDQLLDLARIEAGRIELEPESVELQALSESLLRDVKPLADANGATLVLDVPMPVAAWGDPLRVRQVLLNLLSNACKFCDGNDVTLKAECVDDRVRIVVEDEGVGMTPEELARVFEPFEQGSAGLRRGTGLGLAICRSLCEAMGGTLTADSLLGYGTRFRLELPAGPAPEKPALVRSLTHARRSLISGLGGAPPPPA